MALVLFLLIMLFAECKGLAAKTTTEISKKATYHIKFEESKLICKVDRMFVSIAFSIGQLNKTDPGYDISSRKLRSLLKGLSPAVVRIGGSKANYLYFQPKEQKLAAVKEHLESRAYVPQPSVEDVNRLGTHRFKRAPQVIDLGKKKMPDVPEDMANKIKTKKKKERKTKKEKKISGFRDFMMSADLFDNLYRLINSTGNTMLFDLNAFPRMDGAQSWNSSNAKELIDHAVAKKFNINWQLGNEPNHYKKFGAQREKTGEEVGNDFTVFKNLLKVKQPNAKIIGPDTTRPKPGGKLQLWLGQFLNTAKDTIDALAWHQYYIDGKEAKASDFINPEVLDKFVSENKDMKCILNENNFIKPVWLTETGSAWGGGAKDLSDRFAGMFPYVDKLGVSGENCIQVVARQAFLAGKYAMVNKTGFSPHPEYYAAVLFKRLAARGVLQISTNKPDNKFRVYAMCARTSKHTLPGSVFVFIINLYNESKSFSFPDYELLQMKQYLFTADSLSSDVVKLNNKPLLMETDKLPRMKPIFVDQPIKLPAHSIGYYILDLVSLSIC